MKKIFMAIAFFLIFCGSSYLSGCTGGFEPVQSIKYVTGGEHKSETSYWIRSYKETKITEKEYNESPENQRGHTQPNKVYLSKSFKIPDDKKHLTSYIEKPTIPGMVEYGIQGFVYNPKYYKYEFIGYSYYLIQVKVINDETIEIKNSLGTSKYTVTSYSITYFENN